MTFKEFCNFCNDKRVIHKSTGLRSDFDRHLEERLGEFATNTVFVGHDNNIDGFEIDSTTFSFIEKSDSEIQVVYGPEHFRKGQTDTFIFSEWK